ncbi:Starch-binding associating with outer membrane [Parapedobacter composti]|uniref:Starch-binding associating with outer membrane n=1 Tax=Parapedobacter composti TaxID=623281 RepID=A0A1I1HN18_9SPHI|nr:RagB/SusD family nutrient uptake outer membrane protein [Parapedobacter composti]SFC25354.1 Starch-binding associating with outer membrane [Parapedobacter composti]
MKKLFYTAVTAMILQSCGHLLDTIPTDRYTIENFWESEKGTIGALTACYNSLTKSGTFGGTATVLWEETATPNAYNYDNSGGFNVIALGTHTSATNSAIINDRWNHAYEGIGRCNMFLARVDRSPLDESVKERMKAEAKFLRALYYYLLTTYYGDAPLILDEPNITQERLPRTPRAEVVAQILIDLDDAAGVLPPRYTTVSDIGRATRGAALALKARVLLFEASPLINVSNNAQRWADAAAAAKAVMELQGAGYALFPNYRNLFMLDNENSSESIFDVQFKAPEYGTGFDVVLRQYNTVAPLRNLVDAYWMRDGKTKEESNLYDANNPYANRDPRMAQTIVYPGATFRGSVVTAGTFVNTGYTQKKYSIYDEAPNSTIPAVSEINYMILRYADVLLMYAEAHNEASEVPDQSVYDALHAVRRRAGLDPYTLPSGLSKGEMREIIRRERRIELAGEGLYYTDIRRWRIAEEVMNGPVHNHAGNPIVVRSFNPQRDYWWPITDRQRELNPELQPNPNW